MISIYSHFLIFTSTCAIESISISCLCVGKIYTGIRLAFMKLVSRVCMCDNCILQHEGVTVNYVVVLCEARYKSLWLGILFGYKFIIQGVGVFLAFKIRKVKVSK